MSDKKYIIRDLKSKIIGSIEEKDHYSSEPIYVGILGQVFFWIFALIFGIPAFIFMYKWSLGYGHPLGQSIINGLLTGGIVGFGGGLLGTFVAIVGRVIISELIDNWNAVVRRLLIGVFILAALYYLSKIK